MAQPFTVSLPFDGTASYYDIDAQFQGSSDITCKIVVSGPYPDQPTTVASATRQEDIASAQLRLRQMAGRASPGLRKADR